MNAPNTLLSGWGRTPSSRAYILSTDPSDPEESLLRYLRSTGGKQLTPRGLGRSYGDASLAAGGVVTNAEDWKQEFDLNLDKGSLRVSSGYSLDEIMRQIIPLGYFVPVTPGTRYVSIGGAFGADIHGKNHHVDGGFGHHCTDVRMILPSGVTTTNPGEDLFDASLGGMGLTGFVSSLRLSLIPIETAYVKVKTMALGNIEETFSALEEHDAAHRYSVAWIDCTKTGKGLGRSVATWGDHAQLSDLPNSKLENPLAFDPTVRLKAPDLAPSWLLNPLSVKAFNEFWYRKGRFSSGDSVESISSYFHPLDGVSDWNRLYGSKGFLQYQFVLPFGEEQLMIKILERLSRSGYPSFLAVLKRFGESSSGMLSFPKPGWTLALDLPAHRAGLSELLDGCDELVADAGGRVYLAKDSRISPHHIPDMYPRLPRWQRVSNELDPSGVFNSDLSRRLGLRAALPRLGDSQSNLIPLTRKGPNR